METRRILISYSSLLILHPLDLLSKLSISRLASNANLENKRLASQGILIFEMEIYVLFCVYFSCSRNKDEFESNLLNYKKR